MLFIFLQSVKIVIKPKKSKSRDGEEEEEGKVA